MKKLVMLIVLTLCAGLLVSCASEPGRYYEEGVGPCVKISKNWVEPSLTKIYQRMLPDACLAFIGPVDQAGWWESNLNSRRLRGQKFVRVGCTHCPDWDRDCNDMEDCGGCGTATFNFDFNYMPEDAEIVTAYLAVYALENKENLTKAILQGRLNVGGDYAVIGKPPIFVGDWALFEITRFACRAVVERRNSTGMELSLPCGPDRRSAVALVDFRDGAQPTLVIEYR